ncbi:AAA-associated domain-containing protein [Natrarchaeobius oligotrophus]|uniref:AAA-associated domain-containing protein n=1 Tax=Natrarchaeobius oligotrophus TaxID=3455743 RepID=UPI0014051B3A|nr:AAA-associated domain-containing protein [Natrarchaeobius chitinivorans]
MLREATSGASTVEDLAEGLDIAPKTASNKVHDPTILGLVDRDDNQLSVSEDARRVIQLKDTSPLENAFRELPGVSEVLDRIEGGSVEVEEIGRLISFETGSNAAAESTFRNYGRVYGEWIDYLDLGTYSNGVVAAGEIDELPEASEPLENPRGPNNPRVPPEKVFEILPLISRIESREELQERSDYSDRYTSKILTTCYGLGIAESTRNGPELTERGKELQQTSVGQRKRILREALLEIPLAQAYCERMPEDEFRNKDVMRQVSEDYLKGWSDSTIQTRAKRLYSWLLFTGIAEEQETGYLEPAETTETSEVATS